jgi:FdhD protein
MTSQTTDAKLTRWASGSREESHGTVVRELPFTINLDGKELVTTLCSPADLEYLVYGILFSEGVIQRRGDIVSIDIDSLSGQARVTTTMPINPCQPGFKPLVASGGSKGSSSYQTGPAAKNTARSEASITPQQIHKLVNDFLQHSAAYRMTHGVHSAALCDAGHIIVFNDDIGRHNAIDKVLGQCLLEEIETAGHIMITSGRISSEILLKVAKRDIPILISKSPPTDLGIRLANELDITLIVARNQEILVYTHERRIIPDET